MVFPLLIILVMGIVEYGKFLEMQQTIITVVRSGARYASLHPTSWSSASTANGNTIEGVMQAEAGSLNLQNTDAQITVAYYDNAGGGPNPPICGQYSQVSAAFSPASGYTQATCVKAGSIIKVTISYPYSPVTPVLSAFHFNANLTESFYVVDES